MSDDPVRNDISRLDEMMSGVNFLMCMCNIKRTVGYIGWECNSDIGMHK